MESNRVRVFFDVSNVIKGILCALIQNRFSTFQQITMHEKHVPPQSS